VRDPRRLGPERVRVQIAMGDLSRPGSFRNAMRGVKTVIHLAAAIRDQEPGSIEELNGVATIRLLRAAERAGVERFIFFSAIGASEHSPARFFRAKALAEKAVRESSLDTVVFAPSIVYSPGDPWIKLMERLTLLPFVPVSGSGRAEYQPIWTGDVADAVVAALDGRSNGRDRFELAGPETLSYDQIARTVLRAHHRRRRLLHVPLPVVKAGLGAVERFAGPSAFATWDEAELMEIPMVSERGTADAEALGVRPLPMGQVLAGG
jgi:NADH dehydrogenase